MPLSTASTAPTAMLCWAAASKWRSADDGKRKELFGEFGDLKSCRRRWQVRRAPGWNKIKETVRAALSRMPMYGRRTQHNWIQMIILLASGERWPMSGLMKPASLLQMGRRDGIATCFTTSSNERHPRAIKMAVKSASGSLICASPAWTCKVLVSGNNRKSCLVSSFSLQNYFLLLNVYSSKRLFLVVTTKSVLQWDRARPNQDLQAALPLHVLSNLKLLLALPLSRLSSSCSYHWWKLNGNTMYMSSALTHINQYTWVVANW